jgi:uncharacterized membrane protein YfcA
MSLILGLLLSVAIGLSLGVIGGGGAIITVPVLVYVLDVEAYQAIGMSLAVVGTTSLIATVLHHRRGTLRVKAGLLFSASGIPGAYFGARLTYLLPPAMLLLIFAALMLLVATFMLIRQEPQEVLPLHQQPSLFKMVLAGGSVGVLAGWLGVGGGFLIVPALVLFVRLPMKEAIGTSLFVMTLNCGAGVLGHWHYGGFDLLLALLVTVCAVLGTLAGVGLAHRASPASLRKGYAVFVIIVALFLGMKNYAALF